MQDFANTLPPRLNERQRERESSGGIENECRQGAAIKGKATVILQRTNKHPHLIHTHNPAGRCQQTQC